MTQTQQTLSLAQYYAREGYYRHAQQACSADARSGGAADTELVFWRAFAHAAEGLVSDAIKELESVQEKKGYQLPAFLSLLHYHQRCAQEDQHAIDDLQVKIQGQMNLAGDLERLFTCKYLVALGEVERAREVLSKVDGRKVDENNVHNLACAHGWLEIEAARKVTGQEQTELYEKAWKALEAGGQHVDVLMAKAKVLEGQRKWQAAVELFNTAIVRHTWFKPVLIEKAKTLMMTADWNQALDTMHRITDAEPDNIEAGRLQVLYMLSRESKVVDASKKLSELFCNIQMLEPRNHALLASCAQLFSRLAGRSSAILSITVRMLERAVTLRTEITKTVKPSAHSGEHYLTELGYQQMLMGNLKAASESYHKAVEVDNTDVKALYGIINCRIQEGNLVEAEEHLELLNEVQASIGDSAELAFLSSLIAWRKRQDAKTALDMLNNTLTFHITCFKSAVGYDFFVKLNADFMMEIAKEYLQHTTGPGATGGDGGGPLGNYLLRGIKVLETLTRFVPGLLPAQILLAKSKLTQGDTDAAQRILHQCLRLDPACSDAYILMARIYADQDQPHAALQYLEHGLSHDFGVRKHPLYHLVKAKVKLQSRELQEAADILTDALALPGVRTVGVKQAPAEPLIAPLTLADRASIFEMLIDLYPKVDRMKQATQIVQDAVAEFAGTPEEVRISVANSQLALERGEIDQALSILKTMPPSHPSYTKSMAAMADIYLTHRKDRKAYARCYKEVVDKQPSQQNFLIFGDALLSIHEPADAIKAFKQALDLEPGRTDVELVRKIGRALIQTHDYDQATRYFMDELDKIKGPEARELRRDLARLYVRLQKWQEAIRELGLAKDSLGEDEGPTALKTKIEILVELANVHREVADARATRSGQTPGAVSEFADYLRSATELQKNLMHRAPTDSRDIMQPMARRAANLNYQLGEYYEKREANFDTAVSYYTVANRYDDTHGECILALARIKMRQGELDICEKQLHNLLRVDQGNEEASMMMAELMMQLATQGARSTGGVQEYKDATFYYQKLLERKPDNYRALAKLIFLLKRAGRLQDAPKFIEAAEKACSKAVEQECGLRFCNGVLKRWQNRSQEALVDLTAAQRDSEYRIDALTYMIEIYLSPDNNAGIEALEPNSEALENAGSVESLVDELRKAYAQSRSNRWEKWSLKLKVFQARAKIMTKQKAKVDQGLQMLNEIFVDNKKFVPALLAMSMGMIVQKNQAKARNQLKRIADLAKLGYDPDFADDFEKSWLLLADMYIASSKYDLASSLCHLAKDHNRSCGRAWEQLGLIYEKEQAYKDAAIHYEMAWDFCSQAVPSVGYRLAFNYLKAKRYVAAITVCQKVLQLRPDYPKIREDILNKARASLRTS